MNANNTVSFVLQIVAVVASYFLTNEEFNSSFVIVGLFICIALSEFIFSPKKFAQVRQQRSLQFQLVTLLCDLTIFYNLLAAGFFTLVVMKGLELLLENISYVVKID